MESSSKSMCYGTKCDVQVRMGQMGNQANRTQLGKLATSALGASKMHAQHACNSYGGTYVQG